VIATAAAAVSVGVGVGVGVNGVKGSRREWKRVE
jgi:hypothetical protein